MGPFAGKPTRLQFRLGQWMLLNVYLAIILASVALVARMEGRGAGLLALVGVTTGVPKILRFLTLLLIRPSPRRDALAIVFNLLIFLAVAVWATLFVAFIVRNPAIVGFRATSLNSLLIWYIPSVLWLMTLVAASAIFERRCPACRRWYLIKPQSVQPVTKRRVLLFTFVWCVACGARWKHNRKAPKWADASDPAYDACFGLGAAAPIRRRLADAWKL